MTGSGPLIDVEIVAVDDEPKPHEHFHSEYAATISAEMLWATDKRLLISLRNAGAFKTGADTVAGVLLSIQSAKLDSEHSKTLIRRVRASGGPGIFRLFVHVLPEKKRHILVSLIDGDTGFPGVYRLDVRNGKTRLVQAGMAPILEWWADHSGAIRFGYGADKDRLVMAARSSVNDAWKVLDETSLLTKGTFSPVALDAESGGLLVQSAVSFGRRALYRMDLETGRVTEKLFEHPAVDLLSVLLSRKTDRLLAAAYFDDRYEYHFFDDDFRRIVRGIDKALPGRSNYVLQLTPDDGHLLVFSGSDIYPGGYYSLDRETRQMRLILEVNSRIDPEDMSPMRRVDYFARDGLEIPAYLVVPKVRSKKELPVIIMAGPVSHNRFTLGYDYVAQYLASRGYAVFMPNVRGADGYGYDYLHLGAGEWGRRMQSDLADAAEYLIDEGIADADRICIFGSEAYGGYAALMGVARYPKLFSCAISVSPLTDLVHEVETLRAAGRDDVAALAVGDRQGEALTSISPLEQVKAIEAPVLLIHGSADANVPVGASDRFVDAMRDAGKRVEYVRLDGTGIVQGDFQGRVRMLESMECFLENSIGINAKE